MIENVEALRPEDARSNRRFERLSIVKKHFGDVPLSAISATAIVDFQCARHDAGIANRTINMDVGVLSRVLNSAVGGERLLITSTIFRSVSDPSAAP